MLFCKSLEMSQFDEDAIKEYIIDLLEHQESQIENVYDEISKRMNNAIESSIIEEAFILTLRYNVEIHDIQDFVDQLYEEIFKQKQKFEILKSFQTFDKENTGYANFYQIQKYLKFSQEQIQIISQYLELDSEGNFNYYDYLLTNF